MSEVQFIEDQFVADGQGPPLPPTLRASAGMDCGCAGLARGHQIHGRKTCCRRQVREGYSETDL
eukprot:4649902-Pyramimonas_sp.AAC.1